MKIFLITVACIITASCKKTNVIERQTIAGKWELRQSSGGIAGTVTYNPDNGSVYVFDNTKSFRLLAATAIVHAGSYVIKESANAGDWSLQLRFLVNNQVVIENDSIRFNNNQLIFFPAASCCDMPVMFYEKLP
ncbi:MAG: hypothetical protein ABJB86_10200 [Bacteroidota bacterium]